MKRVYDKKTNVLEKNFKYIHVFFEKLQGNAVAGWATITVCILFFGGLQMVFLGIIGEYVGRIFEEVKNRPLYLVAKEKGKSFKQL